MLMERGHEQKSTGILCEGGGGDLNLIHFNKTGRMEMRSKNEKQKPEEKTER